MDLFIDWLAVFIIVAVGIMIKYFKMSWLIAGYNTSSAEDRRAMSEKGIEDFIGNSMFGLAAILAGGNIGKYLGYYFAQTGSWILFTVVLGYVIIRAQKYVPDKTPGVSERKNYNTVLILAAYLLVFAVVAAGIIYGSRESAVEIEGHWIRIGGIYSTRIDIKEVTDIRMEDSIPAIKSRTNGYAFGDTRKGHFLLRDLGKGRLYIHSNKGPFIYILTGDSYTIINFDSPAKTRKLFAELSEQWKLLPR
ncbi:MAG: DUF3784 domain-containing protein [Syntrophomonadaceae bacterium]|nr:DUF3784 domain-containing protein [Syntrophomonadaceae bacterium]